MKNPAAVLTVADDIPTGWEASNMEPVGYHDLQGRAAFKLSIRHVGERWYLYAALGGLNILDVTDPSNPQFLDFVKGPNGEAGIQVTFHDDLMITDLSRPITLDEITGAADGWTTVQTETPADKPYEEGVLLWDISDPVGPKLLSHWHGNAAGTHRNSYPGGRYAYLSSTIPGYRGFILVILDVSDTQHPIEVGRWAYPGTKSDETPGEVTPSFHGPAHVSPDGKMLSLGYTPAVVNLDITDITRPKLLGKLTMIPPFANTLTQSIHTVLPLWDRKLLYVNSESQKDSCEEGLNFAGLINNENPAKPELLSLFPIPLPPENAPYDDFCKKGGRFGPHNVNTEIHHPDVEKPGNLIYLTYFNAGLRVFNIKNPRLPKETGWFIPPNPPKPKLGLGGAPLKVNQTQDVLVDTRGYVYITDSAWGIWILRYTGDGQPAPTAS
jgi:hypothetical protein